MQPLIAVAGYALSAGEVRRWPETGAVAAPAPYIRAVHRAGGREAVLLPVQLDEEAAADLLQNFDGVLLLGGGDVHPHLYGAEARPEIYGVDPVRDAFEIALVRAAIKLEVPTLAVCRGLQVLNVALGGTLDQHITGRKGLVSHGVPGGGKPVIHPVVLERGSQLAQVMGTTRAESSSHHHQAIAQLARGLVPVARAEDGLVEAMELENGWVIGVQWHPEDTASADPAQQGLFDALVRQATQRAERRRAASQVIGIH